LDVLLKAGLGRLTGQSPEALHFIDTRQYDIASAQRAAAEMGLAMPDFAAALQANVSYQLATDFGRVPHAPGAGLRPIAGTMTYGQGNWQTPRVVLLHGLPLDLHSWDGVAAELPAGSYLRVDLPGNGRSTAHRQLDGVAWLDALLADVAAPVLLVGHSLGTDFALRYAAARPDKVAGLLLVAPYFLQGLAPRPLRHAASGRLLLSLINRSRYEQVVTGQQAPLTPMLDSGYAALRRRRVRRRVADALARASTPAVRQPLPGLLAAVFVPVHLVVGEQDALRLPSDHPTTIIPQGGHNVHVTHPRDVAALITRQLAAADGNL
ncbi:MAG: alpha/beta hydrolase, partial [Anaerolineales bacterium]|nr:alpha/beta hydrolase [Anaerolineales bacterium]